MAHIRMWAGDYTLSGLVGFELRSKTIGILGTGAIGSAAARIFCVSDLALPLLKSELRQCHCRPPGISAGVYENLIQPLHDDAELFSSLQTW